MAYADHSQASSRTISLVIVALIHVILGYAFVTGLGMKYVKKAAEQLNVIDVAEEPPPPEEEPPPPPPDQSVPPPPVVAPPPIVQTPAAAPTIQSVPTPPPVYIPSPAPPPPAPPAPTISKAAGAKGNPANWVSSDDYPASSLRRESQGTSAITWDINEQGRVENCRVTSSSGDADLDEAACRSITRRGRYTPAVDQNGNPIRSSQSRRIVWRLPE